MKTILAIDTASPVLSVALRVGTRKILERKITGFLKHAENVLPAIDALLRREKVPVTNVRTVLINRGPGSFTGLRIGFSVLKGWRITGKNEFYGGTHHDLIAENAALPEKSFLTVCLDAYRGRFYARSYRRQTGAWKPVRALKVLALEELSGSLPDRSYLTGDGLRRYQNAIRSACGGKLVNFLDEKLWYPKASTLIRLYERGHPGIKKLARPSDLLPLYLRRSEAEEKRSENAKRR